MTPTILTNGQTNLSDGRSAVVKIIIEQAVVVVLHERPGFFFQFSPGFGVARQRYFQLGICGQIEQVSIGALGNKLQRLLIAHEPIVAAGVEEGATFSRPENGFPKQQASVRLDAEIIENRRENIDLLCDAVRTHV